MDTTLPVTSERKKKKKTNSVLSLYRAAYTVMLLYSHREQIPNYITCSELSFDCWLWFIVVFGAQTKLWTIRPMPYQHPAHNSGRHVTVVCRLFFFKKKFLYNILFVFIEFIVNCFIVSHRRRGLRIRFRPLMIQQFGNFAVLWRYYYDFVENYR